MIYFTNYKYERMINIIENHKKIYVLLLIAKEFNNQNIIWAVGASLLLFLKGIICEFNDIDIMIAESDVERAKDILMSLGKLQPESPNMRYKTKYFLEFIINGVDIDILAGFTIVNNSKSYYFPLEKKNIKDYIEINKISIPLQSISEWRTYYELIGRLEKVKMIDNHGF